MKKTFLLSILVCAMSIFTAKAQFFYDEPGKKADGVFKMLGDAIYTGKGGNDFDPVGNGWIRLTPNLQTQLGYVIMDKTFPTTLGVTVEFDFKTYGRYGVQTADQADGFCVFLIDASLNAKAFKQGGAVGGGLGFVGEGDDGSTPTYLGVAIDEHGNFSNSSIPGANGGPFSGKLPHSIALRTGSIQPGADRYRYLKGTSSGMEVTYTPTWPTNPQNPYTQADLFGFPPQNILTSTEINRPDDASFYRRVRINFDPQGAGVRVTIKMKLSTTTDFIDIFTYDYVQGSNAFHARPDVMRVGFSATTGSSAAFHEVRNVIVRTPGTVQVIKQPVGCPALNTETSLQTTLSCYATAANRTITMQDTLPAGFVVTQAPTTGGNISVSGPTYSNSRPIYSYTVVMNNDSHIHLDYKGHFTQLGAFSTVAKILDISPSTNLHENELIRRSEQTGAISDLAAVYPAAGSVLYNYNTPVTFTVSSTTLPSWYYSTNGGISWMPTGVTGNTYTPSPTLFNGSSFTVRCNVAGGGICNALDYVCSEAPDNVSNIHCFTAPPQTAWSFKLLAESALGVPDPSDNNTAKGIVSSYGIPLVGDIDNDGKIEIVVPAAGIGADTEWGLANVPAFVTVDKLRILNLEGSTLKLKQTIPTPFFNIIGNGYSMAKVDGPDKPAAIFLCTSIRKNGPKGSNNDAPNRQKLIKYTLQNGTYQEDLGAPRKPYIKSTKNGYTSDENGFATKEVPQPMIVDFNGDGTPEVVVYGRIFNAKTMVELAYLDIFQPGYGSGHGAHTNNLFKDESSSIMAIADMDGDGVPEIVAGDCVYKVEITNADGPGGNKFYLWSKCDKEDFEGNPHLEVKDGATSVADIDLDGMLDVIVTVPGSKKSFPLLAPQDDIKDGAIYVWNPRTKKVIHTNVINNLPTGSDLVAPATPGSGPSVAFVGDIDGDNIPDICFTARQNMTAMYFNATNKQLTTKWSTTTNDKSGSTSMTVFDFNQDGKNELIYRDMENLRVLNDAGVDIRTIRFKSMTQNEYPVVADVDGDGHAEVLITGTDADDVLSWTGQLRIYSSNPAGLWAPARKVWNQFGYNAVNINEDLTVPLTQFNPATQFPGGKRPFNGYLQQQTNLNLMGEPLWPAASARFGDRPYFAYNELNDSLTITVKVINSGSYPLYPPFRISAYKNSVAGSPSKTYTFQNQINPGETFTYTLGIKNFKTQWAPFSNIVIRLNDAGGGMFDQTVCDQLPVEVKTGTLIAIDDYAVAGMNSSNSRIQVSANDIKSCAIGSFTVNTVPGSGGISQHGTFTVSDSILLYTPAPDYRGSDTLLYSITCNNETDTARVFVTVNSLPDNLSDIQCFTAPPKTAWTFIELARTATGIKDISDNIEKGLVSSYGIPLVGDIDNDGTVEIVAPAVGIETRPDWYTGLSSYFVTNKLRIFTFNGSSLKLKQTVETPYYNIIGNSFAIAKVDDPAAPAAIFLCTGIRKKATNATTHNTDADRQHLIKYTLQNGTYQEDPGAPRKPYIKSTKNGYTFDETGYDKKEVPQPMIVDFNGDGTPEVVVYGRIFNAKTMVELAHLDIFQTDYGSGHGAHTNNLFKGESSSIMAIADMDGDGVPEIVAGNCVYKVEINNAHGPGGNQFYLWSRCETTDFAGNSHPEVKDGATAVADIDLDGMLDVIVTVPGSEKSDKDLTSPAGGIRNGAIYVWNPRTKKVIHTNVINTLPTGNDEYAPPVPGSGPSVAFVGDIDNDKKPNICFTARRSMYSYHFNENTKTLEQDWMFETNDRSGSTSMAVFDFNQDGENELVYRDETHLRVLDKTGTDVIAKIEFASYTQNEFPVIADLDGDGHAEILITGNTDVKTWNSQMRVYSSNPAGMWAPARKVWNQFAYNVVNINEDLTVPLRQFDPATVFPGERRPFNGYLQQQTQLNSNGEPLWPAGNAKHAGVPSFAYHSANDSLTITVTVTNTGSYPFYPPFRISAHKNSVPGSLSKTYTFQDIINPGDVFTYTLGIKNFKAQWTPFDDIIIRLNDSGNGASDQTVCDFSLRDKTTGGIIALDDNLLAYLNSSSNRIPVSLNDFKSCPNSGADAFEIQQVEPASYPRHGTASLNAGDTVIYYTPDANYAGSDTLMYRIICNNEIDTATVYINVIEKPDNVVAGNCAGDTKSFTFKENLTYTSPATDHHTQAIPLVGDVDGDGKPEIITAGVTPSVDFPQSLNILWGNNTSSTINVPDGITLKTGEGSVCPYAIYKTKIGSDDKTLIVVKTGTAGANMCAYDLNGNTTQPPVWSVTGGGQYREAPGVADFDGDGIPEVYVADRIYNGNTGKLLVQGASNKGHTYGYFTSAADVNNDGKLELIAGNEVYTVNIPFKDGTSGNSLVLYAKMQDEVRFSTVGNPAANDGYTVVADINNDGKLDVIYIASNNPSSNEGTDARRMLIAWDVATQRMICKSAEIANTKGTGIPLVGNIDSDPLPEVVFIIKDKILGFKPNLATKTFEQKYSDVIINPEGSTGVTMFDFNNDGIVEILHRGTWNLDIMYANESTGGFPATALEFKNAVLHEYPVIADMDNDGAAEIIMIAYKSIQLSASGYLYIYKSGTSENWAPARKVWNQYGYNAVNINEDLTVPKRQLNPATIFPGEDGIIGTPDDMHPYNNFLKQQTVLSGNGDPTGLTPDFSIAGTPGSQYYALGDSLVISNLCVKNVGETRSADILHIAVYRNSRSTANLIDVYQVPAGINVGETKCYKIKIINASSISANSLHLELNDDGTDDRPQAECNYGDNNKLDFHLSAVITARNDRISVFACNSKTVDVLANDDYAVGGTLSISKNGALVTATSAAPNIIYNTAGASNCAGLGGKRDTIIYKVCSAIDNSCSEARLIIDLLRRPSLMLLDSCSQKPCLTLNYQYPAAEYKWYSSPNGVSSWTPVSGSPNLKHYATDDAWYKVEIKYKGETVETEKMHFVIRRKHRLPGNLWWYDTSLRNN